MKQPSSTPTRRQIERNAAIQALIDGPTAYSEADRPALGCLPTSKLLKEASRMGTRKPVRV